MQCEAIQEKISLLLDGELSEEDRALVLEHIAGCPECMAVYEAYSAISGALDDLEEVPTGFTENVMRRIGAEAGPPKRKKHYLAGFAAMAACFALVVFAGQGFLGSSKGDRNDAAVPMNMESYGADFDTQSEEGSPDAAVPEDENAQLLEYGSAIIYQNSYSYFASGNGETDSPTENSGSTGMEKSTYEIAVNQQLYDASQSTANTVSLSSLDEVLSVADTADYGSFDRGSDYTIVFRDDNGNTCSLDVWVDGERLYCEDLTANTAYYANGTYAQLLAVMEE